MEGTCICWKQSNVAGCVTPGGAAAPFKGSQEPHSLYFQEEECFTLSDPILVVATTRPGFTGETPGKYGAY